MQAVNLLPAYARPGHRWSGVGSDLSAARVVRLGSVLAVVIAAAIGALYVHERSVVNDKRSELNYDTARLTAVEAQAAPLRAAAAQAAAELTGAKAISESSVRWESVLVDLARVLPDQEFLSSLQLNGPASGAPGTFSVSGTATSHVRVALVLDRLALLPWLTGITLGSSSRGSGTSPGGLSDSFSVSGSFTGSGATGAAK